ncbi:MAG TPA: site-2 protease family protein [Candidatus Solibacter sp.]|jgi:Zn-dependent protease|nr:site-2 protease family protein [Candidatus Solibacter sp.]
MNTEFLVAGVVWYVVFLLSTTCHEAAHAFVARMGGDLTAFHGGQASLDPLPHIRREPFGMVIFPILSYVMANGHWMMGWASAPYDPLWSLRYPRRAAWMSLAGPGANYSLAILAAILIHVGMWTGFFVPPQSANFMHVVEATTTGLVSAAATFLSLLFSLNLLLGTFNLLPVPPLDGFSAIGLLLPESGARRFQELGHSMRGFTYIGLMIAWYVFDPIFSPLFTMSLSVLYPGQSYGGQ